MTKRYVKTEYDGRPFITAGKVYEVTKWDIYEQGGESSFSFTDDENDVVNCDFPGSDWVLKGFHWIECDAVGNPINDDASVLDDLIHAAEPIVAFLDKALSDFTPDYAERKGPDHVIFGWNNAELRLGDLLALRDALAKARGETK